MSIEETLVEKYGALLTPEKQSHVLLYGANIGEQSAPLSFQSAIQAMLPDWYPAESQPLEIGLKNSSITDRDADYWRWESSHLSAKLAQQLQPRLAQGNISHLSVFALAPQPLLIQLGSLLSDIPTAEVYQRHREPSNWNWQEHSEDIQISVQRPTKTDGAPALVFSLSATIINERVDAVLPDANIWKLSIDTPHNDFLQSRQQARSFRATVRRIMDDIKAIHGQSATIHVFPAMPAALAVEFGRIRMPKADLPLLIYDENRKAGGFQPALAIGG